MHAAVKRNRIPFYDSSPEKWRTERNAAYTSTDDAHVASHTFRRGKWRNKRNPLA